MSIQDLALFLASKDLEDDLQEILQQQIFQEPPDEINETWRHGALLGGISIRCCRIRSEANKTQQRVRL